MKVERIDDNVEDIIWRLEDYFEVLLMMLHYNISLHNYVMTWMINIAGHYHDEKDVLHVPMMMKKPNNGEYKQWRSQTKKPYCPDHFLH